MQIEKIKIDNTGKFLAFSLSFRKLFAAYFSQNVLYKFEVLSRCSYQEKISIQVLSDIATFSGTQYSIILKSLEHISKDELTSASEFMQTEITKMTNDSFFVRGFSGKLDDMRDYEMPLTDLNWKAYHYLQEMGYATPFGAYSINDLLQAGIYKFID